MRKLLSSIACNLDADILSASVPLFEEERVQAIEWSFDTLFNFREIPPWFLDLLHEYAKENRLIGHGVFFSLFSGKWSAGQSEWLKHLRQTCSDFQFDHITEHFGFMTGKDFHSGAPLTIPYSAAALQIGQDRLKRIFDACRCPVGLENLAFSYSLDEVQGHGEFLDKMVEPVNGFIILDLHNLYCQIHNFSMPFEDLIGLYPLDKVREIHISGGSWEDSGVDADRKIRRDTHDDSVPGEVFQLLEKTIDKCPNLKYVVMEQLGTGLKTAGSRQLFYDDFLKMETIVNRKERADLPAPNSFRPVSTVLLEDIVEDEQLYKQQLQLSSILETSASWREAIQLLNNSSLAHSDWRVENWEPSMVETAMKIARKWKK